MQPAKCILLVDDDRDNRELVRELLIGEGYVVATAGDGIAALKKLKTFHVDLLLSDLQMPLMDGIDLIRRARAADPMLVAVLLTAALTDDPEAIMARAGASAYLVKPVDFEHLGAVIEQALGPAHATNAGAHGAPAS